MGASTVAGRTTTVPSRTSAGTRVSAGIACSLGLSQSFFTVNPLPAMNYALPINSVTQLLHTQTAFLAIPDPSPPPSLLECGQQPWARISAAAKTAQALLPHPTACEPPDTQDKVRAVPVPPPRHESPFQSD